MLPLLRHAHFALLDLSLVRLVVHGVRAIIGFSYQELCRYSNSRVFEQINDGQIHAKRLLEMAMEVNEQKSVAAEIEKIVVDADLAHLEQFLPHGSKLFFQISLRRDKGIFLSQPFVSGFGRLSRSNFPLAVSGKPSNITNAAGTMSVRQLFLGVSPQLIDP